MIRILGLDLGTTHPARAIIQLGGPKPYLVGSARENLSKAPPKHRPELAFDWLHTELRLAWALGITTVAIEDPTGTLQGVMRDKQTNAHSLQWLMAQYHRVSERARAIGFTVVSVTPQTVSARLGIKPTRGATQAQRRKEKKAQTKRWVSLCVAGAHDKLSEDECDAIAVAYVGRTSTAETGVRLRGGVV